MKKNGFTVIEIMFVSLAIGVLVVLGAGQLIKSKENQAKKRAQSELEMISTAVLQLAWDTGRWPNQAARNNGGSTEIWNLTTARAGLHGTDGTYKKWKGPYYEKQMVDPWGNAYFFDPDYQVNGDMRVAVGSFGPNGRGPNQYDEDDIYVVLDD